MLSLQVLIIQKLLTDVSVNLAPWHLRSVYHGTRTLKVTVTLYLEPRVVF